jgi:hypothetical protein
MQFEPPRLQVHEEDAFLGALRVLSGLMVLGLSIGCFSATAYSDEPSPNFTFTDISGREIRPFDDPSTKALALGFLLPDCPIANSFIPEINRLHDAFSARGVTLLLIHADSETTPDQAREHSREYQVRPPVVLDPRHHWVKRAGATTSPEVVVFSPTGEIVYRGRINDQYVDLGKRRAYVTSHDLKNAIEAFLAGQPIAKPHHEAVGCPIPSLADAK